MKSLMLTAIAAIAVGAVVIAHAQSVYPGGVSAVGSQAYGETASRNPSLPASLAEWDRAGFAPPSKPGQHRVYGRDGYVTTGLGYNAIVALISSTLQDYAESREHDEATKTAGAEPLLVSGTVEQG
jgi:hypothetical protein